jgi:hypothetical protein
MSTRKESSNVEFVIVRACANEPVRLRFVGVRGAAVDVVGSNEKEPMPFHLTRTYRFDHELYEKMRKAFDSLHQKILSELWDQATPFVA